MKIRKYLLFSILLVTMTIICATPASCMDIINNNLTFINKIYKVVCDIEPGQIKDTFDEAEQFDKTEEEDAIKSEKKYIALTFDDGPHPVYTSKILSILDEKKTPATFFIVGNRAELHPTLLRHMKQAKYEIGNHTYDHVDLVKIKENEFLNQMEKCSEAIYNATGEYPKIYRPPFGRISKANEQLIGEKMNKILWTVDSLDWKTSDKNKIVQKIIKSVKNKSIILMHDFYSQSVEALPEIIDKLKEQGYEFVTVSELKELADLPERMEYFIN